MKIFIDVTGLFSNCGEQVAYDYCIPVELIREVVKDIASGQTVIRYDSEDKTTTTLAVAEEYSVVLDKIRATNCIVA